VAANALPCLAQSTVFVAACSAVGSAGVSKKQLDELFIRLLPSADGQSVVAAVELLTGVLPLAALIRDNKLYQVTSLQQRGRSFGMIRLDDSLTELVRAGRITEDVAVRAAENKKELAVTLKKAPARP